jgi:hypothetical protein
MVSSARKIGKATWYANKPNMALKRDAKNAAHFRRPLALRYMPKPSGYKIIFQGKGSID